MKEVAASWESLPAGGRALVAVSGGLDSMTLLEALFRYRNLHDPARELAVLHVNHGLRGEESDGDEAFVREECDRRGLPFVSVRFHWDKKPGQAECRERRLAFFRGELKEADRLFLAHHRDDQAETVLLRLLRGSGLRGLGAMRASSGPLLRPFLALGREEIRSLALSWGLRWREDSSNRQTGYERNWIRAEVLPLLESRRPGIGSRLAALALEAQSLTLPEKELFGFDSGEGWRLYRDVGALDPRSLSRAFGLSRLHTRGLAALLQKGAGAYTAEKEIFRLSAGLLLAGRLPLSSSLREGKDGLELMNALGRWRLRPREGERVGLQAELGLGEKGKKEFQRKRVPVFFRPLVPLLVREGKAAALLASDEGCVYEPSAAALWWLTPSGASDGPADGISRGDNLPRG